MAAVAMPFPEDTISQAFSLCFGFSTLFVSDSAAFLRRNAINVISVLSTQPFLFLNTWENKEYAFSAIHVEKVC